MNDDVINANINHSTLRFYSFMNSVHTRTPSIHIHIAHPPLQLIPPSRQPSLSWAPPFSLNDCQRPCFWTVQRRTNSCSARWEIRRWSWVEWCSMEDMMWVHASDSRVDIRGMDCSTHCDDQWMECGWRSIVPKEKPWASKEDTDQFADASVLEVEFCEHPMCVVEGRGGLCE